jgi:S-adenosylmethionine synthetase
MSISRFSFEFAPAACSPVRHQPQRAAQVLAGAILDALRSIDPRSRVACELQSSACGVVVRGEVSPAVTSSEPGDAVQQVEAPFVPDYVI